jgi:hypothetical protein
MVAHQTGVTKVVYTLGMRDRGGNRPFAFINRNLEVQDTMNGCAPLTRADAEQAKTLMLRGAKKLGRRIEVRVLAMPDQVGGNPPV